MLIPFGLGNQVELRYRQAFPHLSSHHAVLTYPRSWGNVFDGIPGACRDAIKSTAAEGASDYLGNYGPLQVYILGEEDDELADPAHQEAIAQVYCGIHNEGSEQPFEDCLEFFGLNHLINCTQIHCFLCTPCLILKEKTSSILETYETWR